jgi:uncharacterized protein involved in outer membrane biogenesis
MKKKPTLPLLLITVLALSYLIPTLLLNQFLSEERLRLMLVEPAEAQLDRKIDIGSIKVSLFSGINLDNITIHGKNPEEDFLSIATFRLTYQFLPLLQKRLVITKILIDQPTIRLARNAKGVFNFADLSLKPKKIEKENLPPEEQAVEPLPLTLVFDKITINDANLTFVDQTGELPEIISSKGDLVFSLNLADKLAESSYQGNLRLIVNASITGHQPVLIMNCDFNEKQAGFSGDLTVEFQKVLFDGLLTNLRTDPDLTLNLQSSSLDLVKLAGLKPAAGPAQPIPPGDEAAQPAPSAAEPGKFSAHGQIAVGNLTHGKLALQKLNLNYAFKDRQLAFNEINFEVFGGKVTGQLQADISRPVPDFQGKIKVGNLRMAEAMASLDKPAGYLDGELSAELAFQGDGHSWPVIRKTLDGDGEFSLIKGGLADSPYSRALANILEIPELNDLSFDELAGVVKIAEGRIALLCTMTSAEFDLQAKGRAGLDGSFDLPLTIQLSPENSQRLQEKSKYAGYLTDQSGRTTLNLKLTGTVGQPQLALDSSGTGQQVKTILEKEASEELSRAITNQLGDAGNEQANDLVEELSNRFLKQLLDN